jgi:hypothetical protein
LGEQETELEGANQTGVDKINLDIEIVKRVIKSSKSNTSCGVGVVHAELIKSGFEKLYDILRQSF